MSRTNIPAHGLSPDHFRILKDCTTRVASTDIARQSYAQILDGAPNSSTSHYTVGWHNVHDETCEEAFRAWDTFRDQFSFDILTFNPMVIQAYQNATLGSQQFVLHLLELVANACHDIAVMLFKLAKGGLRPRELAPWPHSSYLPAHMFVPEVLPPTVFSYGGYTNVEAYPNGVADCTGYWVEFEIFGGVIVFDRGKSGSECKSAFIHPGGDWMIAELSDSQLQDFLAFGLGESDSAGPPFPWKGERGARRVDPYESFDLDIYRDRYERLPPGPRRRCVRRAEDFPEFTENAAAIIAHAATEM